MRTVPESELRTPPPWLRELFPWERRALVVNGRRMAVLLPGAGHFIQEEAGAEIAREIRDWLRAGPGS